MDFLAALDTQLFLAVHSLAHYPFVDRFVMLFTGRFVWVPLYAAIAWSIWRSYGTRNALVCLIAIGLSVLLADQICATLIRPLAERLRPANLQNPISEFVQVVDGYRGGSYGFPSCHAANTFALATFMMLLTRNVRLSIFVYSWAIINCYTRLYLGVHYPGDLLVGASLGGAIALLIYLIAVRLQPLEKLADDKNFYPTYIVGAVMVIAIAVSAAVC